MPPLAGDPATLFAAADTLAITGGDLDATGTTVRGHADLATGAWFGAAGDAARTALDRTAGYVHAYAANTTSAAPVVRAYAEALQAAQQAYATGEAQAARAGADLATATTAHTNATTALNTFVATSTQSTPTSANAAEQRATREATLQATVDSASTAQATATSNLNAAHAAMDAARAALAAADQAACAALNALTNDLNALQGAIQTSTPAPVGSGTGALPTPSTGSGAHRSYLGVDSAIRPTDTDARSGEEAKPEGHWWDKAIDSVDAFMDEHDITWSDVGHTTLDAVGMIPVIGEAADGANAVWYLAEGDYTNAAISGAAMIPGLGAAVIAGKYGAKGVKGALEIADNLAHSPAGDAVRRAGETVSNSVHETRAGLAGAAQGLTTGKSIALGGGVATASGHTVPGVMLSVPSISGAAQGFTAAAGAAKSANAARPFKPSFGTAAFSNTKGAPTGTVDAVEQRLLDLTNDVIKDFKANKLDLSDGQYRVLDKAPWLRWAFQGQVMDSALKKQVADDAFFAARRDAGAEVTITPQGLEGPDFENVSGLMHEGKWYDLTTAKSWPAHAKYNSRGRGVGIFYR